MLRERGQVPGNGTCGLGRRKRTFPLLSSSQAALSPKGKTRTWPPSSTRAAPDGQLSGHHADAGRPPPQGPPLPAGVGRPFLRRRHPRSLLVALRNGSSLRFAFSVFVLIFLAVLMLLGWTVQLQLIERKSVRFVCVCVK